MKYTKYVSPEEYNAMKSHEEKMSHGMFEPIEMEMKAVDMNYGFVPMGVLTQKDKESKELLEKAVECNAARFGLGGVPY